MLSDKAKLVIIATTIIVIVVMIISAQYLGSAGNFMQNARESGVAIDIPSSRLFWNMQFISYVVAALFGGAVFVFLKETW